MIEPLTLVALGALFLLGLAADLLAHRTGFPRVTLLLLIGLAVGDAGFDLIPEALQGWYAFLSTAALTMVAFLLGSALSVENLREHGVAIMTISIVIVLTTLGVVSAALTLAGLPFGLALVMAAIATATAPAATNDVITQSGVDNSFTRTLRGIVAIDDVWGLITFSVVLVVVSQLQGGLDVAGLEHAAWEIGGAIGLGLLIGLPASVLTGRLNDGEPLEIEALSLVFFTSGLALWLDVSFLITGMVVGAVIVNLASHHKTAFHEIEHIQWPFIVLFFILAGATLDIGVAMSLSAVGIAFVAFRSLARVVGGWLGAWIARAPVHQRAWFGVALLPQAGVAIGMALIAGQRFPDWADQIIALTIGTTVLFELVGPIATLVAIRRMADDRRAPADET